MIEPATVPLRRTRRRLAFGLRTLMLFVLAVAAVLGWKVHRAKVQRRAVARIEAAGGAVTYDFSFGGESPSDRPASEPPAPAWLRRAIGDEFFQEVTAVSFHGVKMLWTGDVLAPIDDLDHLLSLTLSGRAIAPTDLEWIGRSRSLRILELRQADINDSGLSILANARRLRRLDIGFSDRVTDAGLASLRGLLELEEFSISGARLNGPGLAHLADLPALRSLRLGSCQIDDACLASLLGLERLQELDLFYGTFTDAGMGYLEGLTGLESLKLKYALEFTDDGLIHLRALHRLKRLDLSCTMVTDRGLPHLASLESLEELDLHADEVSDAGLVHLLGLRNLRKLMGVSKVSDEGIAALAQANPGLTITRDRGLLRSARAEKAFRDLFVPRRIRAPASPAIDRAQGLAPPPATPAGSPGSD